MNSFAGGMAARSGGAAAGLCALLLICGPAEPAAADERPDLQRELTYIGMDRTGQLLNLAIEEQKAWWHMRTEEKRAKALWIRQEGIAFARLATEIQKDLDYSTRLRSTLRASCQDAARFVNGNDWRGFRHGFNVLLESIGHTRGARRLMDQQIPSIAASDFRLHVFGGIVEPTGELRTPPSKLLAETAVGSGQALFRQFRNHWNQCADELRSDLPVPTSRQDAMRQTVADWRTFLERTQEHPGPSEKAYLAHCDRLVETLGDAKRAGLLAGFLKNRGHEFPGGRAGDLLLYVIEHDLVPRPGTQGHVILAGVTDDLIATAKAEIALLERRIEELKAQSPAHNAVLRQRMIPEAFGPSLSGKHAGLDSPAFVKPKAPRVPAGRDQP